MGIISIIRLSNHRLADSIGKTLQLKKLNKVVKIYMCNNLHLFLLTILTFKLVSAMIVFPGRLLHNCKLKHFTD